MSVPVAMVMGMQNPNPIVWPPIFSAARPSLVRPMSLDPSGLQGPTPRAARGHRYRRTSYGRYLPAAIDGTVPDQRIVEAAAVLPPAGAVTGWAALHWLGGQWFTGTTASGETLPVDLVVCSDDIRPQQGIAVSAERLSPLDVVVVDGLRITSPVRSLNFVMRYAANVRQAVMWADMAAYSDLVSIDELAAYCAVHSGWTGIPKARAALNLMHENSWSPMESFVRTVWSVEAELPALLCNTPVFDRSGALIGTPDLLDLEAGLILEYDGPVHLDPARRRIDVRRGEAFRRHGLETLTFMSGDGADVDAMAARMRAFRARARIMPPAERSWTIETPAWWTRTDTVDARRDLSDVQKVRLLGYRRAAG